MHTHEKMPESNPKEQMHDHKAHEMHEVHGEDHAAHVDHRGHEMMFRRRFWVSTLISIPVLLFSPFVQDTLGFAMPEFPGAEWITPVFAVVVFVYGGLPFLRMAVPEVKNRRPGMMLLISLAITVAFVYSLTALFIPASTTFFWELVTLIDIMLLGHWLEMRSVRQASGALDELARLMPDKAERISPGGDVEEINIDEIKTGDLLLVRPGTSIPADGTVEEGNSDVNEAMITGESRPVSKAPGDQVIGGSINSDGSLRVRVHAAGDETALAGIMRLVE
jgi:Cu2+-exporting ATPase